MTNLITKSVAIKEYALQLLNIKGTNTEKGIEIGKRAFKDFDTIPIEHLKLPIEEFSRKEVLPRIFGNGLQDLIDTIQDEASWYMQHPRINENIPEYERGFIAGMLHVAFFLNKKKAIQNEK